ncbi:hypothetical protein NUW54_g4381 [Trametes sanguinea]|uniref:Uncharacterized protein n=1 Tax=Trametes sanguinea TaxID=158606 RepID=A0ACC1PZN6_9APHY|nr:hypothetical protein NUW54_g4381 [Trametes sanguinea]
MMQTAALYQQLPPLATKQQQITSMSGDSTRASVTHLLAGACSTPCSTAAHTFMQIVPPLSRFQLALEVLMPMLDSRVELPQRILVSYMLYALYAPHPIAINPFKSVLHASFTRERDVAVQVDRAGGVSENEQLVWVLWKILKGDGSDVRFSFLGLTCSQRQGTDLIHTSADRPFSPNTLARSPLPPKLRAAHLSLEEDFAAPTQAAANAAANSYVPSPHTLAEMQLLKLFLAAWESPTRPSLPRPPRKVQSGPGERRCRHCRRRAPPPVAPNATRNWRSSHMLWRSSSLHGTASSPSRNSA